MARFVLTRSLDENNYYNHAIFGLNLAKSLELQNKKVLYINTNLSHDFLNHLKLNNLQLNTKLKTITPFVIFSIKNNLDYLNLLNKNNKKLTSYNLNELTFVLKKQIDLIIKNYDFVIVNLMGVWNELDEFFLNYFNDHSALYIDVNNVDIGQIIKTNLKQYDYLVIDHYLSLNKNHINCFKSIKTIVKDFKTFVINENENALSDPLNHYNRQIGFTNLLKYLLIK